MAVPDKVASRTKTIIDRVRNSTQISMGEADDYIEFAKDAEAGTNGLSIEDKVQANAVNIANLCFLFIKHALDSSEYRRTWKDVFIECKWAIVVCVAIIAALLFFHPEIAQVIQKAVE